MQKSVYSIVLSDDVVAQIDRLAYRHNTNRSNMINQILAEYVSYVTPEKRMQDTFRRMESILQAADTFQVLMQPTDSTLTLRSAIAYKYNPSVRYAVELYRTPGDTIGELRVSLRSQNSALLLYLTQFFRLWMKIESAYLPETLYRAEDGRLTRSLRPTAVVRNADADTLSSETLGDLLSAYVALFDNALKCFFYHLETPSAAAAEMERMYRAYLSEHEVVL
jgi:predicted transcriptional regulator